MLANPSAKYRPFPQVPLSNRNWPDQRIQKAPIWMSTDLRDGNQALIEPMSPEKKLRFFKMLVKIGFKEIEVGFPSASQTDYDFVRLLIEEKHIPDDVSIIVLCQARDELIKRTFEAVKGANSVIVHIYNSVAPVFRKMVFNTSREEITLLAVRATKLVRQLTAQHPQTHWRYEYSPESFSTTELDFAKHICDAVTEAWNPTPLNPIIFNLPATVESSTPNIYADQIEWMHKKLARRDAIILSVHPHNDRGSAVASAELALMAGADRVEGCIFGNGERTGNVDIVTLALNLYTQGVSPGLDFSDIDAIRQCVEDCNQLPVHPRHPYVGDLVFTAFSGSHQDAIKKGFARQKEDSLWEVPYLPIDPADLGRNYDAVIRVNSQSGKGGMAYLLEHDYGLALPRRLQIEFSKIVQTHLDQSGKEIEAKDLHALFSQTYLEQNTPYAYLSHRMLEESGHGHTVQIDIGVLHEGQQKNLHGTGHGAVEAFVAALGLDVQIMDYHEHAVGSGAQAQAACYIELRYQNGHSLYGAAIDGNIVTASFKAILSALNRQLALQEAAPGGDSLAA